MGQIVSQMKKQQKSRRNKRRDRRQRKKKSRDKQHVSEGSPTCSDDLTDTGDLLSVTLPFVGVQQVANVATATQTNSSCDKSIPLGMMSDANMSLLYSFARNRAWAALSCRCQTHPDEAAVVDYLGDNALHWTVFGRPPIEPVRDLLLANAALARVANRKGYLPLHVACSYRASAEVIKTLLDAYPEAAGLATTCNSGSYPLHFLCDFGSDIECMRVILNSKEARSRIFEKDRLYCRRPLEVLNGRKNLNEFQRAIDTMRRARQRQQVVQTLCSSGGTGGLTPENIEEEIAAVVKTVQPFSCTDFWRKAAMLILVEHTGEPPLATKGECNNHNDDDLNSTEQAITTISPAILRATIANPLCPPSLQEYSILLHYDLLLSPLDDEGNLPLHIAAASGTYSVVKDLVAINAEAASVRNHQGDLPLSILLKRDEKLQWFDAVGCLLEAYPRALWDQELDYRLYARLLARLSTSVDRLYGTLHSQPDLFKYINV